MDRKYTVLSHKKYARIVVALFAEFLPGKSHVPMDTVMGPKLSVLMGLDTAASQAIMAKMPYRQLLGSLMYLFVSTRLDLGLLLSRLSFFSLNPGMAHWNAALKILAYVAETPDVGVLYRRSATAKLNGVTDASFAGDPDKRRSQGGYLYLIGEVRSPGNLTESPL